MTVFHSTYRVTLKSSSNRDKAKFMRILITAIVILTGLSGGYIYWWNLLADQSVTALERWKESQRSKGVEIEHSPVKVEGFPYRIHLSASSLLIRESYPNGSPMQRASVPEIWAIAQPWNLSHMILGSSGKIDYEFIEKSGDKKSANILPEKALASVTLNSAQEVEKLAIDFGNVTFDGNLIGSGTAQRIQLHTRSEQRALNTEGSDASANELKTSNFQQIALRASELYLNSLEKNPLGPTIDAVSILAETAAEFKDFKDRASLQKWRDQGGVIDITDATVKWGQSKLETTGSLTLDQDNYLLGAFNTKVEGFSELFSLLATTKGMNEKDMKSALFALNLLAKTDKKGNRFIEVPVSLQDQAFYIGPLKLFRLSPLF